MILRVPDYYDAFHCIAGDCKHNCCEANWEIDVDEKTYQYYCGLGTEFGEQLKDAITKDEFFHFKLKHGKCPFLSKGHLCQVYQTLGEKALCKVCTVYPRMEEDYGRLHERILGLSCEEAGRILFTHPEPVRFIEREAEDSKAGKEQEKTPQFDRHKIEAARDEAIAILQDRTLPLADRFSLFLLFCNEVQQYIEAGRLEHIEEVIGQLKVSDMKAILKEQKLPEIPIHTLLMERLDILLNMDVVQEEWGEAMNNVMRIFYSDEQNERYAQMARQLEQVYPETIFQYEQLMVYFADQYLMHAVYDGGFFEAAKYCMMGYLTIHDMDMMKLVIQGGCYTLEDRIENVRLFCKQVEHSAQSERYLKEKVKIESVFSLEALLKQCQSIF